MSIPRPHPRLTIRARAAAAAACVLSAFLPFAAAKTIPVSTPEELAAAARAAAPGDTLVLRAGDWRDAAVTIEVHGTAEAPVTLTAATPGGTRFTGASKLSVQGSHAVIRGLLFTEGFLVARGGPVLQLSGDGHRLTDTAVVRYNPPDPATGYSWLILRGRGHRVDHCRFEGQYHRGQTLRVLVEDGDNRVRIDHNHFLDRPRGDGNGFETIQVGLSQHSLNDSLTVVERNLFESCDGEIEIISNKSGGNSYRGNTFLRCAGALTLRHGDRCLVEGNVFLGEGKPGAGGLRIIGKGHVVRDNYFEGVGRGNAGGAIIAANSGVPDSPLHRYFASDDALVENNYLFDPAGLPFHLSSGLNATERTLRPKNVRIEGNWIVGGDPAQPLVAGEPGENLHVAGNHVGGGRPAAEGFVSATEAPDRSALLARLHPVTPAEVGPAWWPRQAPPTVP